MKGKEIVSPDSNRIYQLALTHDSGLSRRLASVARLLPVGILMALVPFAMQSIGGQRLLLGSALFLLFWSLRESAAGTVLVFLYLAVLGGLRRWLILWIGWSPNDPLLLVAPAFVGLYFLNTAFQRRIPHDTRLSKVILWFVVVLCLQIFNPTQGGLQVGLAGTLFYLTPVLWYYVGRDRGTPTVLNGLFKAVVAVAILASVYGLYQTYFGFSAADLAWIKLARYSSLEINGTTRAMSFMTSPAEYLLCLSIGVVLLWGMWLRGNFVALLPIPLLAVATFVIGARGPVVGTLGACTFLWAVRGRTPRSWIPRLVLAVVLAVSGLVWSMGEIQNVQFSTNVQGAVSHQTEGLLKPGESSAGGHANMMVGGVMHGFTSPLGRGIGSTTMAAGKFGGSYNGSEEDLGNMFLALGLPGGLLYLVIIALVFATAFRNWNRQRTLGSLCLLGVLFACLDQWMNGAYYPVAMLVWFCIGALDRPQEVAP